MNDRIKILIIIFIIIVVTICSILVAQKSKTTEVPQNIQQNIEAPQKDFNTPEVPQEPVIIDENSMPKSDYKVPEIG